MGSAHTKKLEALLRATPTPSGPELKLALTNIAAEVKNRLSSGSSSSFDFFASTVRALAQLRGTTHSEIRMSCMFDCAHFFYTAGFSSDAVETTRLLGALARGAKNKWWLCRIQNISGIVSADTGNFADALVHYSKALSIARELEELDAEFGVVTNLGVALNYAGLYREAIQCFDVCAARAKSTFQLHKYLPATLTNLAQSYLYLEEFDLGFQAICGALATDAEPEDAISALSRTVREFTYVQLALELGQLSLAREHGLICRRYGHWGDSPRGRGLANLAEGLVEIHGGDVERGFALLDAGLSSAKDPSFRIDALRTLVRANDEVGRPERALELMRMLLSEIRRTREKGALALLSFPSGVIQAQRSASGDLRAMEHREAKLRAVVAERELLNSRIEMLERLAITADLKEEASGEHGYRVGRLAALLAHVLKWNRQACSEIELAARLHDVGKIGIPDRILLTSQQLREAERRFMSAHTLIGAELLAKSNIPQLRMAEEIARYHHEWWDGTGYPAKLKGKRIPMHARIVALADVFDALTHGRPYSPPWSIDQALDEISSRRGTQFDPDLANHFIALIQELRAEHCDLDEFLGRAGRNSEFSQARKRIKLMLTEEHEREQKATVSGTQTRH